jgi:molybdopterin molybdotransferase
MRAVLDPAPEGLPSVLPARSQDSSLLSTLAEANCLVVREAGAPAIPAGSIVTVLPLDM